MNTPDEDELEKRIEQRLIDKYIAHCESQHWSEADQKFMGRLFLIGLGIAIVAWVCLGLAGG